MPSAFMQDETGAAWKPFSKGSRGAVGPTVAASPASPLPAGLLRSPQKPPLPSAGPCPRGGAPLTVLKGPGSIAEPLPALPEAFLTSAATNPSAPWWPTLCGSLDGAQTSATTLPCQPRECKLGGEDGGLGGAAGADQTNRVVIPIRQTQVEPRSSFVWLSLRGVPNGGLREWYRRSLDDDGLLRPRPQRSNPKGDVQPLSCDP
jgi:hypothetical protein